MHKYIHFFILFAASLSHASQEHLGTFSLSDILLQPQLKFVESDGGEFSLERSYIFTKWEYDKNLSVEFGWGQLSYITPSRFSNTVITSNTNFGIFEAYGQWDSNYGVIRAGLVPINFGYEGGARESQRLLPDTLFLENHYFGLRDYGATYSNAHNGFFTLATVHNGEGGTDIDGNLWFTEKLGWKNRAGLEFAFSGQIGEFRSAVESKTRIVGLYSAFNLYKINCVAEGFVGDSKSTANYEQFHSWHVDLNHPIGDVGIQVRYDILDPNKTTIGDQTSRWIAGLNISNEQRTSTLFLWGIKNLEEGTKVFNDEIMLVWKINSLLQ